MTIVAMRNPLVAWRAGTRWPLALIAVLIALVVVIGVCEAIGWPFLVGPVQRQLAKTLDRRVVFGNEAGGLSGVRIGLIGSVRVQADDRDRRAGAGARRRTCCSRTTRA